MRKKPPVFLFMLLLLLWVGMIFLFSSQSGTESYGESASVSRWLAGILYPDFSAASSSRQTEILESLEPLLRKGAHYLEYSVLGFLGFLAVRGVMIGRRARSKTRKPFSKMGCGLVAFYPCVLIATCDEVLQTHVGGRTSSVLDVLLDCAGILTGLILCGVMTSHVVFVSKPPENRHRKGGAV